ncbi:MAG: sulfur carrier protein ThiS [Turneriella sp.]|nr:sulfur carrier protein ThiS [Turneriella sp.]
MMVNGEKFELQALGGATTLVNLIGYFKLSPQRVAVELNGDLVPRTGYGDTKLAESDVVEIIHYVGGG